MRDWGEGGSIWAMHYRIWVFPELFCFVIFSLVESCESEQWRQLRRSCPRSLEAPLFGGGRGLDRARISRSGIWENKFGLSGKQIRRYFPLHQRLYRSEALCEVHGWPFWKLDFLFSVCDHCQSIVNVLLYIYSMLNCDGLPQFTMFNHWHL